MTTNAQIKPYTVWMQVPDRVRSMLVQPLGSDILKVTALGLGLWIVRGIFLFRNGII